MLTDIAVRPVRRGDVPRVVAMVHELAAYEKAPDECRLTETQLSRALFCPHPALFGLVATACTNAATGTPPDATLSGTGTSRHARTGTPPDARTGTGDRTTVGFALWFRNFSTWEGVHGVYLEDLYVTPEARGHGVGRRLLASLAAICRENGYKRLEWWVLDWNPARRLYHSIGATAMEEWVPYRLSGDALDRLARQM